MMQLAYKLPTFSAAEYLNSERDAAERHEYLDGVIYMMAGESRAHSLICFNLIGQTYQQLLGGQCRGYSPNMKVRASANAYFYPDLTIVCGEPRYEDATGDVVVNPTTVFEVLSPSTEKYDRAEKRLRYIQIESLQDYILISQTEPRIEHYTRNAKGEWLDEPLVIEGMDSEFEITSINCRLKLRDVYHLVEFKQAAKKPTRRKR